MNLLGHYVCAENLPLYERLGSILPDLLTIYRRKVRVRALAELWREFSGGQAAILPLLRGLTFHHAVDLPFHKAPFFERCSAAIHATLLEASDTPGLKRFLPAHVLSELYFDQLLIARDPELPARFHGDLRQGGPAMAAFVGRHPLAAESSFQGFLEHIEAERFAEGYRTFEGIFYRMNRILINLRQRPLEEDEMSAVARALSEDRLSLEQELLEFTTAMQTLSVELRQPRVRKAPRGAVVLPGRISPQPT